MAASLQLERGVEPGRGPGRPAGRAARRRRGAGRRERGPAGPAGGASPTSRRRWATSRRRWATSRRSSPTGSPTWPRSSRTSPTFGPKPIRSRDIAKVRQELAPSTVTQIDGIRAVTLTATPDTDNLGALTQTVQPRLAALDLPAGVEVELGGASDDQAEAFRELGLAMLLAIVLVFLIMVADLPQPGPAADPAHLHPVRRHRRGGRPAAHRHRARRTGDGRPADADRHRGDQRHRADRPDQQEAGHRRGSGARRSPTAPGCGCGRSS